MHCEALHLPCGDAVHEGMKAFFYKGDKVSVELLARGALVIAEHSTVGMPRLSSF